MPIVNRQLLFSSTRIQSGGFAAISITLPKHRFKFQKRSQLFICPHNKAFTVAAMSVSNPDCSALRIQR
jgi:hypothetical protein